MVESSGVLPEERKEYAEAEAVFNEFKINQQNNLPGLDLLRPRSS